MEYLVLHTFRSFGETLVKGSIVEGTKIRSPHMRLDEGLITQAVSSAKVPEEENLSVESSETFKKDDIDIATLDDVSKETVVAAEVVKAETVEGTEDDDDIKKPLLLTLTI